MLTFSDDESDAIEAEPMMLAADVAIELLGMLMVVVTEMLAALTFSVMLSGCTPGSMPARLVRNDCCAVWSKATTVEAIVNATVSSGLYDAPGERGGSAGSGADGGYGGDATGDLADGGGGFHHHGFGGGGDGVNGNPGGGNNGGGCNGGAASGGNSASNGGCMGESNGGGEDGGCGGDGGGGGDGGYSGLLVQTLISQTE